MNKKYLMKGMAALAIVAGFSSCVKDVDGVTPAQEAEQAKENAELQLGIVIPDGQTWDMASQVEASVTVNGDFGAKYTVSIYENNPFQNNNRATVLGKAEVTSGSTVNISFTCPDAATMVFAAIKDEKGYSYVKPANVKNGKVEVVFGENAAGSRAMRTATNSHVDIPTGTPRATIEAEAAAILAKSVELNATNNEIDSPGYYWTDNGGGIYKNPNYVINYLISGEWNGLVNKLGSAGHIWGDELINGAPTDQIVPRTVYVQGKWTIPSDGYQACGNGYTGLNDVDGIIVVGTEGELEVNGTLNMANLARIIVLPGGKVTGTGTINVCNGSASGKESYNFGTISVKKLNENFGNFFNYGTINSEELIGGAGSSCFVNYGKVKVTTAYGNNGAPANLMIKNNCWFEASGEIAAKVIENAASAYITCASMKTSSGWGGTPNDASYIAVDNNSLLHVEGMWRNNNTSVYGPTSGDNAFIEIGTIKQWDFTDGTTGMIQNNIYFSFESIERSDNNSDTGWCVNYNVNKGGNQNVVFINKGAANVAPIDESECAPGYTPVPPTPIWEDLIVYTYAFEDQTVGSDYDMNDVVLKVNYHVTNTNAETGEVEYDKTKLDVLLVALGATYEITAKIGNADLFKEGNEGKELHQVLGVNKGIMVNTGDKAQNGVTPKSCTVAVPAGWNGKFAELPVSIHVSTTNKDYSFPNNDAYPHAVMIPVDWAWPTERTNVIKAYPKFKNWATSTATPRADSDWYNKENAVEGNVVQNN